jgi:hypothetical protein
MFYTTNVLYNKLINEIILKQFIMFSNKINDILRNIFVLNYLFMNYIMNTFFSIIPFYYLKKRIKDICKLLLYLSIYVLDKKVTSIMNINTIIFE